MRKIKVKKNKMKPSLSFTILTSLPLITDTPFLLSAQILSLSQLYDSILSLLVFSHLLSFQRYRSTCGTFEKPISWPFLQTWLLFSLCSKSPIPLSPFLLPMFSSFSVFSLSFSFFSSFFSLSFCFYHPNFSCFGLHCFPHSSRHLIIFTFSILQSISGF